MSEATHLEYGVLAALRHDEQVVALVSEADASPEGHARLRWWLGRDSRDCRDGVPVVVDGAEACLEEHVSISQAIEAWAELSLARDRASLYEMIAGGHDVREPASLTLEEIRQQAAEEVIEHSYEGLFATLGGVFGATPDPRFWTHILEAAAAFPQVFADLLWEEKLLRHRMSRA